MSRQTAQDAPAVGPCLPNHLFTHQTFLANGPVTWIEEVMVAEEVRRRGIGHTLMVAAENWSASKGAAYVAGTRRAADFYLALGYTESAAYFRKLIRAREQTSPRASTNRPPGPLEVDTARGSARALNWGRILVTNGIAD